MSGPDKARGWWVERPHPRTTRIHLEGPPSATWCRWFLLRSDAHHDNRHCRRDVEHRHLQEAEERDAIILDCGDLFCAMQGKWDKRADPTSLRDEYRLNYLDSLVREAAALYEPYAHRWALMSPGNHETSIRKRHETDLTERLVTTLNERTGSTIQKGDYAGWIQIRLHFPNAERGRCGTFRIAYHHGYGGGGPVTKGTIQSNRRRAMLRDYDLEWMGHIHESWVHRDVVEGLASSGRPMYQDVFSLRTPGYKDEWSGGNGWHVERGAPPKPIGAWWMKLEWCFRLGRLVPTFEEAR